MFFSNLILIIFGIVLQQLDSGCEFFVLLLQFDIGFGVLFDLDFEVEDSAAQFDYSADCVGVLTVSEVVLRAGGLLVG